MTYVQAGTYIFKTAGATAEGLTVDGQSVKLLGNVYHLVKVNDYASFDASNITAMQVPNNTFSITIA